MSNTLTTEQGRAALDEFGFELVEQDKIGAPTPGRIADRLSDIVSQLEEAVSHYAVELMVEPLAELRRLRMALDAWDYAMMRKRHEQGG